MSKVFYDVSMSLDGYIAGPNSGPESGLGEGGSRLHEWLSNGDAPSAYYPSFKLFQPSAEILDEAARDSGAVVAGRHTYDCSKGWSGGSPTPGAPLFVVTHKPPVGGPTVDSQQTFVSDGIMRAVELAREAAGDRGVGLMGGDVAGQCMQAGLIDEIQLHIVPIVLSGGARLFGKHDVSSTALEQVRVIAAPGVTHIRYRVLKF